MPVLVELFILLFVRHPAFLKGWALARPRMSRYINLKIICSVFFPERHVRPRSHQPPIQPPKEAR